MRLIPIKQILEERKPRKYIVEGILRAGTLNMFFGAPSSMKSLLLASLAVCVASGQRWLTRVDGSGGFGVTQCPVLWLDYDNGLEETEDRFHALLKSSHVDDDNFPLHISSDLDNLLDASSEESCCRMERFISSLGAKLVIIDNFTNVRNGIDENSSEISVVMHNLRKMSEHTGACIILLHHPPKYTDGASLGALVRGHGSINAALGIAMYVSRKGQSEEIEFQPAKVRGVPFNSVVRVKWNYKLKADSILQYGHFSLISVRSQIKEGQKESEKTIEEIALHYFQKNEGAKKTESVKAISEIAKEEGVRNAGIRNVTESIDAMIADGILEERGNKSAKLIFCAGE